MTQRQAQIRFNYLDALRSLVVISHRVSPILTSIG